MMAVRTPHEQVKSILEPGRAYYVWREIKTGFIAARSLLRQVDEEIGRKGVLECRLAQPMQ